MHCDMLLTWTVTRSGAFTGTCDFLDPCVPSEITHIYLRVVMATTGPTPYN